MALRVVEVVVSRENIEAVAKAAEKSGAIDTWRLAGSRGGPAVMRILVEVNSAQMLLDRLHTTLNKDREARVVLIPALATLPEVEEKEEDKAEKAARSQAASREELYNTVAAGVQLNRVFFVLVLLSTVVASIGLLRDNVAVVIGAMVIAPLLGPNLAFAFAIALGDRPLMLRSLRSTVLGFALTIGVSMLMGLALPVGLTSHELMSRTSVSYDSIALALASGAAAVLSLTSGVSSVLVGVMVAVALLPPAATFGFMLGSGQFARAMGAGTLLAVNLVCVVLSAQIVLLVEGIKPRAWWDKKEAHQSMRLSIMISTVLLIILAVLIYFERPLSGS